MRLPLWLIRRGVAGKGIDCETRRAAHYWYNIDGANSGCYYCGVERPGRLWEPPIHPLHELDVVRVIHLGPRPRHLSSAQRSPQIGDTGTIVSADGENGPVYVESVAPDGWTIWLATFDHNEIEVIWCPLSGDVTPGE